MAHVRIFQPDKSAMQSGKRNMGKWVLQFEPSSPYYVEPLMGWTGQRETTRQLFLRFPTSEAAVEYAKANGLTYEVIQPKPRKQVRKTYADNFKYVKTS